MVPLIKQTYKAPNDACEKQHTFGYIVVPWCPWESGSRMLQIPKSIDAQVPDIKWPGNCI